jgi:hypothetical protein
MEKKKERNVFGTNDSRIVVDSGFHCELYNTTIAGRLEWLTQEQCLTYCAGLYFCLTRVYVFTQ